ncbi:hypothetical protein HYV73_02170 [Candidatus Uhrbacteria bacterium]|nr:hypothetical protein [Candidatus Uhrbacteria bacterium]
MRDFQGNGGGRQGGYQSRPRFGGGGRSWGGGQGRSQGTGGFMKELFDAVCAECGNHCQVPFRPNGKKPVYCKDCFQREEEDGSRGGFGGDRSFQKPSFSRSAPAPLGVGKDVSKELRMINEKLDAILSILEDALVIDEGGEEGESEEGEETPEGTDEEESPMEDPTTLVV